MADISKLKLPSGEEINIKDYRIPGVDSAPTSGSDNVVTSGGLYNSLALKQDIIRQSNGEFIPILEHTYENYTCSAADVNNGYVYFMQVVPTSDNYYQPWYIRYTLDIVTATNQCQGKYDVYLGSAGMTSHWIVFNRFYSSSYYPSYYHLMAWHSTAAKYANRETNPIRIGERIYSAYGTTTVARTYKIRVWETVGCTVSFPENIETYGSFYTDAKYGYNSTFNSTSNGLIDQYDANTVTFTQQTNNYLVNATENNGTGLRMLGYSLFGFDEDGNALAISVYSANQTSYTTGISEKGTRLYCTRGFDYTKGIRYISTSNSFEPNANVNVSTLINVSGQDFRCTDNCIASSTANALGMVLRKPVYLRGTIGSDGLFYLAPIDVTYNSKTYQRAWVQDVPTIENENGEYVYWFIGYPYYNSSYPNSLYQINLITQGELVWYKNGSVRPYVTDINATLDDIADGTNRKLSDYINNVVYDSTNSTINFKNGNTTIASVDAAPFIVDGMIDNVSIVTPTTGTYANQACLFIDFNIASGKTDIYIPLSDIFDPDDYYTKTDADNRYIRTVTLNGSAITMSNGTVAITDTRNTAGATDTSSKIFLIGATEQTANPQTYSDNEVYATSGVLTTKSVQVGVGSATIQYNSTDKSIEFIFA